MKKDTPEIWATSLLTVTVLQILTSPTTKSNWMVVTLVLSVDRLSSTKARMIWAKVTTSSAKPLVTLGEGRVVELLDMFKQSKKAFFLKETKKLERQRRY